MYAHYFIVFALICSTVVASLQARVPKLQLEEESPANYGTIYGSPILTVFHGRSDIVKEDFQNKDTDYDPLLEKMGPIME